MSITPEQIAGVLTAGGYTVETFAATMGRLASLDAYNRLVSARALMLSEHNAARAAMDAELSALDAQIAKARRVADEIVGGGV